MKRHLVLVTPPAVERAEAAWGQITPHTIIVCGDYEQAVEWADAAPAELRAHAVTGLARTVALLKEGRVGILAGAYADLAALVARAALKLDSIDTLVLAWPEGFAGELDTLLAEAPDARRVVLSWNPTALDAFLERHARRPEIVGNLPLDDVGQPLGPVGSARYAIVASGRKRVRDVLDVLRAVRPYVWSGGAIGSPVEAPDAVVAAVLPTRDELRQLAAIAPTTVLVLASQLSYLRSIATLTPLTLPSPADRAQDRSAQLRSQIAARLRQGDVDAELAVLAPLFEEHAPAMVAAALLAISRQPSAGSDAAPVAEPSGWVRLFVPIGTSDRASAKDLVGAFIKEGGLLKGQIGKVDVREKFSLVEVAPVVADQAIQRMSGVAIRGRRVAPRRDRP
ncbi:MAG TPA: DbpA RNA binding domain-containing protein [Gemmatimonadales bacterium]|nr:DbpA RNA binding domain-containing protein [Gemmatimonadales bacterium]